MDLVVLRLEGAHLAHSNPCSARLSQISDDSRVDNSAAQRQTHYVAGVCGVLWLLWHWDLPSACSTARPTGARPRNAPASTSSCSPADPGRTGVFSSAALPSPIGYIRPLRRLLR